MAITKEFPLRMAPGVLAHTLDELRAHFNVDAVLGEYRTGRLERWLRSEGYTELADKVGALNPEDAMIAEKLRRILLPPSAAKAAAKPQSVIPTPVPVSPVESPPRAVAPSSPRTAPPVLSAEERAKRLKLVGEFLPPMATVDVADRIAFSQSELETLANSTLRTIYLYGDEFVIPSNANDVTFIGLNNPRITFGPEPLQGLIECKKVAFDVEAFMAPIRKRRYDEILKGLGGMDPDDEAAEEYLDFFGPSAGLGLEFVEEALEREETPAMELLYGDLCRIGIDDPEEAMRQYESAAAHGSAAGRFKCACCYMHGYGVPVDEKKGLELTVQAAREGSVLAQMQMAMYCEEGAYVPQNRSEACEWYEMARKQGSMAGTYNLAVHYATGDGVKKNLSKAVSLLEEAGELGYPGAYTQLGYMYMLGEGVREDEDEAYRWFTKAADGGDAGALHALGRMYLGGIGVARNPKEGFRYLQEAAQKGNVEAERDLGYLYVDGCGVPKDFQKGFDILYRAAQAGDPEAQYWLGATYLLGNGVSKDSKKAIEWLEKAADQGQPEALTSMLLLSMMGDEEIERMELPDPNSLVNEFVSWLDDFYDDDDDAYDDLEEEGLQLLADAENMEEYREAVRTLKDAAEDENSATAQFCLGCIYALGIAYKQNDAIACTWFRKAAKQGNVDACYALGLSYRLGLGVSKNATKADEWFHRAQELLPEELPVWEDAEEDEEKVSPARWIAITLDMYAHKMSIEKAAATYKVDPEELRVWKTRLGAVSKRTLEREIEAVKELRAQIAQHPDRKAELGKAFERKIWLLIQLDSMLPEPSQIQ